jgi:DNA processing protein
VGIVGTRAATHYGREVAAVLGAGLAAHGVSVVSGLANGIDAAAHEGALAPGADPGAVPVAVVGAGLDVGYPVATARLRRRVEAAGAVLGEAPLGAAPESWRFPLRNRVIAALSQVVVVVESHRGGGSLHTVEAALARGIEVMAVPGSIRSPASTGTNALIASGAQVVTCVEDVLEALARNGAPVVVPRRAAAGGAEVGTGAAGDPAAGLSPTARTVLAAVESTPVSTQEILERLDLSLGEVALALDGLEREGLVHDCGGAWVLAPTRPRGRGG